MKTLSTTGLILIVATTGCSTETASSSQGPSQPAPASDASAPNDAPAVQSEAPLGDAVQIAAGARHTCAVHTGGAVTCWGDNGAGQLGVPVTTSPVSLRPMRVRGLGKATRVAAGGDFTCAQMQDGALWCWGANTEGQLGRGYADTQPHPEAALASNTKGGRVALGGAHACLGGDAATTCWGSSASGETGDKGNSQKTLVPVSLTAMAAPKDLTSGTAHTCALLGDGGVYCWGDSTLGQLGMGKDGVMTPLPFGLSLPKRGNIVRVVAGGEHTCALDDTGVIMCWGRSDFGQVGYQSPQTSGKIPAHANSAVQAFVHDEPLADIAAGGDFTCGMLKGGAVFCFGANARGQLGTGLLDGNAHPYAAPVESLPAASALTAGSAHACAIVHGDKATSVHCWGANDAGQLGIGTKADSAKTQAVSY